MPWKSMSIFLLKKNYNLRPNDFAIPKEMIGRHRVYWPTATQSGKGELSLYLYKFVKKPLREFRNFQTFLSEIFTG
jgi:hypothetical protein